MPTFTDANIAFLAGCFQERGRLVASTAGGDYFVHIRYRSPTSDVTARLITGWGGTWVRGTSNGWVCYGGNGNRFLAAIRPHCSPAFQQGIDLWLACAALIKIGTAPITAAEQAQRVAAVQQLATWRRNFRSLRAIARPALPPVPAEWPAVPAPAAAPALDAARPGP